MSPPFAALTNSCNKMPKLRLLIFTPFTTFPSTEFSTFSCKAFTSALNYSLKLSQRTSLKLLSCLSSIRGLTRATQCLSLKRERKNYFSALCPGCPSRRQSSRYWSAVIFLPFLSSISRAKSLSTQKSLVAGAECSRLDALRVTSASLAIAC